MWIGYFKEIRKLMFRALAHRRSESRYTFHWRSTTVSLETHPSLQKGFLKTMVYREHRLSSSWAHCSGKCDRLKTVFLRLKFPKHHVNSTIKSFVDSRVCDQQQPLSPSHEIDDTIRVVLPFKDRISADIVRKQLMDLRLKVHTTIQPVFVSRKIEKTFFYHGCVIFNQNF